MPKRLNAVTEILRLLGGQPDVSTTASATTVTPVDGVPGGMEVHTLDGEFHSDAADTTDLDATADHHGLLPKLPGESGVYLDGTGAFTTPSDSDPVPTAAEVSYDPGMGPLVATDVQAALDEVAALEATTAGALDAHEATDTYDHHNAEGINFFPTGTIAATDVQAAIEEVAAEADATAAAIAALAAQLHNIEYLGDIPLGLPEL